MVVGDSGGREGDMTGGDVGAETGEVAEPHMNID